MGGNVSVQFRSKNYNAVDALDQFRKTVNVENPKNKGYVRLRPGSDGKITVEKFNNKIDILKGWRSYTKEADNKTTRDAFATAIEGDLRYVDVQTRAKVLDLIRKGATADGQVKAGVEGTSTETLSRKEAQKIFSAFDEAYNTGSGRKKILERFYSETFPAGLKGVKDSSNVGEILEAIGLEGEARETLENSLHDKNVSERDFRAALKAAEIAAERTKTFGKMTDVCLTAIDKAVAGKERVALTDEAKSKINPAIEVMKDDLLSGELTKAAAELLGEEKVKALANLWRDAVLPLLLQRKCYEPKRDGQSLADLLSRPELSASFEDFMLDAAADAMRDQESEQGVKVENSENNPFAEADAKLLRAVRAGNKQNKAMLNGLLVEKYRIDLLSRSGIHSRDVNQLLVAASALVKSSQEEEGLQRFTEKYLARTYPDQLFDSDFHAKSTARLFNEEKGRHILAAQVQYGSRFFDRSEKRVKDETLSAKDYIKALSNHTKEILNGIAMEGDDRAAAYARIYTYTLPTLMNRAVSAIAESKTEVGAGKNLVLGGMDGSCQEEKQVLSYLCRIAAKFQAKADDNSLFKKQAKNLDSFLKKGLGEKLAKLDESTKPLLNTEGLARECLSRALNRFFAIPPSAQEVATDEKDKAGTERLEEFLTLEFAAAINERQALANVLVEAHARGLRLSSLVLDAGMAVQRLATPENGIAAEMVKDETSCDALKRLYNKLLANELKGGAKKGDAADLQRKVEERFLAEAKRLQDASVKFDADLRAAVGQRVREAFEAEIKGEIPSGYKLAACAKGLGAAEQKAFVDGLVHDVLAQLEDKFTAEKRQFIACRSAGRTLVARHICERDFANDGGLDGLALTTLRVMQLRFEHVGKWFKDQNYQETLSEEVGKAFKEGRFLTAEQADSFTKDFVKRLEDEVSEKGAYYGRVDDTVKDAGDFSLEMKTRFTTPFLDFLAVHTDLSKDLRFVLEEATQRKENEPVLDYDVAKETLADYLARAWKALPDVEKMKAEFTQEGARQALADKLVEVTAQAVRESRPIFDAAFEEAAKRLEAAGFKEEEITFIRTDGREQAWKGMEEKIRRDPCTYIASYGKRSVEDEAKALIDVVIRNAAPYSLETEAGRAFLAESAGLKDEYADASFRPIIDRALDTWGGNEAVRNRLEAERRQVIKESLAYMSDAEFDRLYENAEAQHKTFSADLQKSIGTIKAMITIDAFNENEVAFGKRLFDEWVVQFKEMIVGDGTPANIRNVADSIGVKAGDLFNSRVKAIQEEYVAKASTTDRAVASAPFTPLLDQSFLSAFVALVNETAGPALLNGMLNEIKEDVLSAILKEGDNAKYIANGFDANELVPTDDEMKTLTQQNFMRLQQAVTAALTDRYGEVMADKLSVENIQRFREVIREASVAFVQPAVRMEAKASELRYQRAEELKSLQADTERLDRLAEEAINAFFGVERFRDALEYGTTYKTGLFSSVEVNTSVMTSRLQQTLNEELARNGVLERLRNETLEFRHSSGDGLSVLSTGASLDVELKEIFDRRLGEMIAVTGKDETDLIKEMKAARALLAAKAK